MTSCVHSCIIQYYELCIIKVAPFLLSTVTKYIGYYAELPVPMPRELQKMIFDRIESSVTPGKNST